MSNIVTIGIKIVAGICAVLMVLALALVAYLYEPLPEPTTSKQRLAMFPLENMNVTQPVQIRWDAHMIPFIEAKTDADAAYALGLVHAHLRLGQMELARHIAYGRLSELAGAVAEDVDHTLRVINFPKAAEEVYANMPPHSRQWVDRFSDGVNDYMAYAIEQDALPYEYKLFDIQPTLWHPKDSIAIGRIAGADYSWLIWFSLLEHTEKSWWGDVWRTLYHTGSGTAYRGDALRAELWQKASMRSDAASNADVLNSDVLKPDAPTINAPESVALPLEKLGLMQQASQWQKGGSNAFAIAPARSKTGAAIIANDPHLGLQLPNLWMVIGMDAPSYKAVGMMAPGIPVFAFGRTSSIAWGGTNLHAANGDLYDVSTLPDSAFTWHEETLHRRFATDKIIRYRSSKYGVVISDAPLIPAGNKTLALRWIGHNTSDEITAMLEMARATNWQEFQYATRNFALPAQNFIYADSNGHIGKMTATHLPMRKAGDAPKMFSDTAQYAKSWGTIVGSWALPSQFIPDAGYVVSANDPPPDSNITVGYFFSPPDRAKRISGLLDYYGKLGLAELKAIQMDVYSSSSLLLRDTMLKHIDALDIPVTPLLQQMRAWDGHYTARSKGAVLYQALLSSVAHELYNQAGHADILAALQDSAYFEDLLAERLRRTDAAMLRNVFVAALPKAEKLAGHYTYWGDAHKLEVRHVLSALPWVGEAFHYASLPAPGSRETVYKRAHGLLAASPHAATFGAQSRHISDMGDLDANYFVLMGGQDGWINSANFKDQIPLWGQGEMVQIPMHSNTRAKYFDYTLTIKPKAH